MPRGSEPDLDAELSVDIVRFPFYVYLGRRKVAALYTGTLVDAIRNTIKHKEETNKLIDEYNFLVDVVKGRRSVDPAEVRYKRKIVIRKDDGDDFYRAYGVQLGQVWKTKGSYHHYEVTEIDPSRMGITLKWIGTFKYIRTVELEVLKRKYELVEEANKALILAVTRARMNPQEFRDADESDSDDVDEEGD